MAKKKKPTAREKQLVGPHPLSLAGERHETPQMERRESPAFEKAERRLGIEGHYAPMKKKAKKQSRGK
jgi:hypothetical protein